MNINTKCLAVLVALVSCGEMTTSSLPSFISPCYRDNPNLQECILKEARNVKKLFISGIPEIGVPSLDPLQLGDIDVMPKHPSLKVITRAGSLTGLKNATIVDIKIDPVNLKGSCHMLGDFAINANYTIDGQFLVFPVKARGQSTFNMKNFDLQMTWEYDLYKGNDGLDYLKIKNSKTNYQVEKLSMTMNGVFDMVLGDMLNQFFNENLRVIMNEMGPPTINVVETHIVNILNKFSAQMPLDVLLPLTPKK